MSRAEKRAAILAALKEDATRSDRAIAVLVGASPTTVGEVRKRLWADPQIETGRHGEGVQIETGRHGEGVQIKPDHCPDWLRDPAKRTPAAVAAWLIATFPDAVDRIIAALQRREVADPSSQSLVISWEAARAARDLARLWSTARLD